ncbi:MAG: tetratricopeptide repeat protein, partial [Planctomycetes bacterium]|nr:tetratricopeptide repeat protein [Planctomycetota bacterium]
LAVICLKSMEKELNRRYQTMRDFADDLRRFLADQPILAKPPSVIYKSRKWVQRNYMAAACLGAIVAGFLASTVLWQRAEYNRKIANSAATALGEVVSALAPSGASSAPERTKKLLDDAESSIRERVASPALRAQVFVSLAKVVREAGDYRRSLGLLDEAKAIFEAGDLFDGEVLITVQGARGDALMNAGEFEQAKTTYIELLEEKRALYGSQHVSYFSTLNGLGSVEAQLGNFEKAEGYLSEAFKGLREAHGLDSLITLRPLNNLGAVFQKLDRDDEASEALRMVVEGRKKLLGDDHPDTLSALSNWSAHSAMMMQKKVGEYQGADAVRSDPDMLGRVVAQFNDVIKAQSETLGEGHPDTLRTSYNLVILLQNSEQIEEAEELAVKTLKRARVSMGDSHLMTLTTMSTLAGLSDQLGKEARAGALHQEAVAGAVESLGDKHPITNDIVWRYAQHLVAIREYDLAAKQARFALPGHIEQFGESHPYTVGLKQMLGFLETKERLILAWELVDPDRKDLDTDVAEGLRLIEAALTAHDPKYLCHHGGDCPYDTLAWAHYANGNYDEAISASKRALELAPEERKTMYEGYLDRLQRMIAAQED